MITAKPEPENTDKRNGNEVPTKPPGYASITATKDNKAVNETVKDEMPPIDDWNAEIAKEEQDNNDSKENRGGRGGRGGRGRGNFRGGRGGGGKSFEVHRRAINNRYFSQRLPRPRR